MDKRFIALALVAFVGVASAASVSQEGEVEKSPLVVYQNDTAEVAGLSSELKELFGDYCLKTRDYVKSYKDANGFSAIDDLFDLFTVDALESILKYGTIVYTGDLCKMVKTDFTSKWGAVADVLHDVAMGTKFGATFFLSKNGVLGPFLNKVDATVVAMKKKNGLARARDACTLIRDTLKPELKYQFGSTMRKLSHKDEHIDDVLESTDFSTVGCALTKDLETLSNSCEYFMQVSVEDYERIGLV